MANRITHAARSWRDYSPLPDDVLPNIMLRVEDRQDFKRLACTCRGFYAWSEPWLKSRRQAAALDKDPLRLTKLPAWIKTHSRHLHRADWNALQRWDTTAEGRILVDVLRRSVAFNDAALLPVHPAPTATSDNAAHLDFILFSPRLLPDINDDAAAEANERLVANASFVLAGFKPAGEAWQCDLVAGATAWLKANSEKLRFDARSKLLEDLSLAMASIMSVRRSPEMVTDLAELGHSKSHYVSALGKNWVVCHRWENPLLRALLYATSKSRFEPGSTEASAFLCAIHQIISTCVQMKESPALAVLVDRLVDVMALMPETTWNPGSAGTDCLQALVQAVRDLPDTLAEIQRILLEREFVSQDEWSGLLLASGPASTAHHGEPS
jgi:hypothetical protein